MLRQTIALLIIIVSAPYAYCQTWQEVQATGKGGLVIYWRDIPPFMQVTEKGVMDGLEYQIIQSFVRYLKNSHQVEFTFPCHLFSQVIC